MSKPLTEKQVLKKLGIPDFRHMTKAKVMQFATMLPYMDPDVAKMALEQFPEFAKRAPEITSQYKEIIEKGFESNDSSVQAFYKTCNAIVESLQKELDKENITPESQKYIIEQMTGVAKMIGEKDTENKKFLRNMAILFGTTVVAVVAAAASVLGSNSQSAEQDDDATDDI